MKRNARVVAEVACVKIASVNKMDVIVCPVARVPARQFVAQAVATPSACQYSQSHEPPKCWTWAVLFFVSCCETEPVGRVNHCA
jgi:hypothetical protein